MSIGIIGGADGPTSIFLGPRSNILLIGGGVILAALAAGLIIWLVMRQR